MKRVVVAGGAGFIGSHLCESLLQEPETEVVCLDNFVTGRQANIEPLRVSPQFVCIEQDITDPLPLLSPVDEVYNLASPASPVGYQRHAIETLRVNSEGTRALLDMCEAEHARFLYASTSEVYGDPLEHPQREDYRGNVSSIGPRSMYDEAKRYGEALTMAYIRDRRVDGRIVRIFNTYGPHSDPDDGRVIPNFVSRALRGEPLELYGDGNQTRSFCFVTDLVEGLLLAMDREGTRGEVINLGNPEEHTIREIAEIVQRLAGASGEFLIRPSAVGDDPQRRRPDIGKAMRLLGWRPRTPLDEGLRATISDIQRTLGIRPAKRAEPA